MKHSVAFALGAWLVAAAAWTPAAAQEAAPAGTDVVPATVEGAAAGPAAGDPAGLPGASPLLAPAHGYTYVAAGRRDPFVNLLQRGAESDAAAPGTRPRGLTGLRTGEVTLRGTLESRGGYVGIVHGADSRTYIVRPGDRLADGTIQAITPDAMVILQQVHDPLARDRAREVRKVLRQTDEAQR